MPDDDHFDPNDPDTDKKITTYAEFLRRRFPGANKDDAPKDAPPAPLPGLTPDLTGEFQNLVLPTSPHAVMAAARLELTPYFELIHDEDNPGLKILRQHPRHKILNAVWENNLGDFMVERELAKITDLRPRWYWHFPEKMQEPRFVTPAHLVRDFTMAVVVGRHQGDYNAPDSDGRKPLHYIAAYGKDAWLIPYLVSHHHVDPCDSGRVENDHDPRNSKGDRYEEPVMRAIDHGNAEMVRGFLMLLDHRALDLDRARNNWGHTPLILAVQAANEAAQRNADNLPDYITIVRDIASEPLVDVRAKDKAGNSAEDYALDKDVRQGLLDGMKQRDKNRVMPRPRRTLPSPAP